MARRTNKTNHVLSLLSGTDITAESDKQKSKVPDQKVQDQKEPDRNIPVSAADQHSGNVHVVLTAGEDPVAEIVKDKLLEELNHMADQESAVPQRQDNEEKETIVPDHKTEPAFTEPESKLSMPEEAVAPLVEADAEAEGPLAQAGGVEITDPPMGTADVEMAEPPVGTADVETAGPPAQTADVETAEPPSEMEGYVFYNIMEKIVKNKAIVYMKRFGNCTCERCEADTIALTLSKLPPKYVVIKSDSVSPLINFYEDHFAGQIIVEITKACIVVDKNPRHNGI